MKPGFLLRWFPRIIFPTAHTRTNGRAVGGKLFAYKAVSPARRSATHHPWRANKFAPTGWQLLSRASPYLSSRKFIPGLKDALIPVGLMGNSKRRPLSILIAVLAGATAVLALAPGSFSPLAPLVDDWIPSLDHRHVVVVAHLLGFSALVVIVTGVWGRVVSAAVAVFLFSALLELAQTQVAWREGSWSDLSVNAVAVLVGVLVVWVFRRVRRILAIEG